MVPLSVSPDKPTFTDAAAPQNTVTSPEVGSPAERSSTNSGDTSTNSSPPITPTSNVHQSTVAIDAFPSPLSGIELSDYTPPRKYRSIADIYASCQFALVVDPISYKDASIKEEWQKAMAEEMASITKNETWQLQDLPQGKNALGLKWVFKTKFGADGKVQQYKARIVAKGYAQQHGVDFEETFAPVAGFETVRMILALAAQQRWDVYQLDVKSAFLNGYDDPDSVKLVGK